MDNREIARELVKVAKSLVADGDKRYYTMQNVGKVKYMVNYHDGEKTHRDGSPFYDIATFSNKKDFAGYIKNLERQGYRERNMGEL